MDKKGIKQVLLAISLGLFGFGSLLAWRTSKEDNYFRYDYVTETKFAGNTITKQETELIKETITEISMQATETYTTEATTQVTIKETEIQTTQATELNIETTQQTQAETETKIEEVSESGIDSMYEQAILNSNTYSAFANEVRELINLERENIGVCLVSYDSTLDIMASYRATENAINDWFRVENNKHIRPNGEKASSICIQFNQTGYFGEVMGRYQITPSEIVLGWHNSPTHYACMTNSVYTRVGIGIAQDNIGNYYWVAIFMN